MNLCIAIPTRNRASSLIMALDALLPQITPGDELLVIDDGSTDTTDVHAGRWFARHRSHVSGRVITIPHSGASAARNAALLESPLPIVAFIDDDERPCPGWLDALRSAWSVAGDRVAAIGGPMYPAWEASRPPWLADYLLYVISVLDLGGEKRRLTPPSVERLWGGNMSVRVAAAAIVGGFDEQRGVRPGVSWDRGEDEDLQERLLRRGWEIWYEPAAAIEHVIPPERLSLAYFRQAFRNQAELDRRRGLSRRVGLIGVLRAAARYTALSVRRDPEAVTATFSLAYSWSLMRPRAASR